MYLPGPYGFRVALIAIALAISLTPVLRAQSAEKKNPVILCFGDSLTAGRGLESHAAYPSLLQLELDRQGYRYHVINSGISGNTTRDGIARLDTALSENPSLIVLELGANDGFRNEPIGNIRQNLIYLIEAFQRTNAIVILAGLTLPSNYNSRYARRFTRMYSKVAAERKIILVQSLLQGVEGNRGLMQADGLHPNAAGTRIVAQTVFRALKPILVSR